MDHVLSICKKRQQEKIARHDEVGKEIYKSIGKKYGLCEHYVENPGTIQKNNVTIYWNKKTLYTPEDSTKNQPDITLIDRNAEEIIVLDMSIVHRSKLEEVYKKKLKQYTQPTLLTKQMMGLRYSRVIPIIITVEGIIHKLTAEAFEEIGIKVDWGKILYKLLIFNINMIQKSYNENWRHRGRRLWEN